MIVVDTGPLVALINTKDQDHELCLRWYDRSHGRLIIPASILAEVSYLLEERCDPLVEARFFCELAEDDQFEVVAPGKRDFYELRNSSKSIATFR